MAAARQAEINPLALTMGDPAGIGPELALKAWVSRSAQALTPFCVYGSATMLRERAAQLRLGVPVEVVTAAGDAAGVFAQALPVIDIALAEASVAGRPSVANGRATIDAIERAVADVWSGAARAVVTNPIAKSVLYEAGFKHPGHTASGRSGTPAAEAAFYALALSKGVLVHASRLAFLSAAHTANDVVQVADVFQSALADVKNDGLFDPKA